MPLIVLANKFGGRLGSARNTAAESASGEVLAFLDDDAAAAADWLERLIAPYDDERVGAVGGAPLPVFEATRPRWFPHEFDWVFGCAYRGLPLTRAPLAHLIGANMSVRTSALREVGGFHSDDHDDMDMCHRIAHARHRVLYEPRAVVHHCVPASRTTWHYFWRRCYFVNQGKVEAFANMRQASSLGAELAFVSRTLTTGVLAEIRQVARGDLYGLARVGAIVAGIALAGLGHMSGQLRLRRPRRGHWNGPRGRRRMRTGPSRRRASTSGASGERENRLMVAPPLGQVPRTLTQLAFDDAYPAEAMEFVHDLHLDDRLTLAAVADLADRLPRKSVIADTAAQPLLVPQGGPPRGALERPGDVIRDLHNANAWLTLLNVEDDPGIADLMNTQLDQLEAGMIAKQGKMPGGWRSSSFPPRIR